MVKIEEIACKNCGIQFNFSDVEKIIKNGKCQCPVCSKVIVIDGISEKHLSSEFNVNSSRASLVKLILLLSALVVCHFVYSIVFLVYYGSVKEIAVKKAIISEVKKNLVDPNSLMSEILCCSVPFGFLGESVDEKHEGKKICCANINAKNRMGGYVGRERRAFLLSKDNLFSLSENNMTAQQRSEGDTYDDCVFSCEFSSWISKNLKEDDPVLWDKYIKRHGIK